MQRGPASPPPPSELGSPEAGGSLIPPHLPLPPYLLLLLLLVLLGEEGVDPPDLGKHAAVRQAEAKAEEPQAELEEGREGGGGEDRGDVNKDVRCDEEEPF